MPMSNQKVSVLLELKNRKEHRLGVPLPKGKVRVNKADAAAASSSSARTGSTTRPRTSA
jgi:hypothetical protein